MRSKVFISLFIVFAMVATAMLPLSTYDNNSISAAGGDGSAGSPFLISNVEELSKVGTGTDGWTLAAHYRLTQNIVFDSTHDTINGGVKMTLAITYTSDNFTVTVTSAEATVSTLNVWLGTNAESNTTGDPLDILAPSDPGTYTLAVSGNYNVTETFAYAVKIDTTDFTAETTKLFDFDSNGNFDPIGDNSTFDTDSRFTGTFDGAGFKISGMNVAVFYSFSAYAGLFGYVEGDTNDNAVIKNLDVTDGYSIGISDSYVYAGGIAGRAERSNIENCYNSGYVIAIADGTLNVEVYAGGIAGRADRSNIENCYNIGNVTVSGNSDEYLVFIYAGGIFGYAYNSSSTVDLYVENCYNIGNVTATADGGHAYVFAGGIFGCVDNSSSTMDHYIKNCYNTGDVTATANGNNVDESMGGIAGYAKKLSIENCYNIGNVTAIATADKGQVMAYVGGIAGYISDSSITNCYNAGDVTATADGVYADVRAGGIVGNADSSNIKNCYNIGDMTAIATADGGDVPALAGGIAGDADDESIIHSYFLLDEGRDLELTGRGDYEGVEDDDSGSRSDVQMRNMGNYTEWNFETDPITWSISSDLNDGFPVLEVFMFTLTLEFEGDGNVTGPVRIYGGSTATVIMVPDEGGKIISVTDNGKDVTVLVSDKKYDITNIFGERTVKVVFESIAVPDIDPDIDGNSWGLIILIVIMTTVVCSAYFFALKDRDDDEEEK